MDESTTLTGDAATADTAATGQDANPPADGAAPSTAPTDAAAKPAESAAADDKPAEGDKPQGAPEAYEAFTAPEGFAIDEHLLGTFAPVFKDLNLSQEQAQKLVDAAPHLITPAVRKAVETTQQQLLQAAGLVDAMQWAEQVKTDKVLGGEKLAENMAVVKLAGGEQAPAEVRALFDLMKATPWGNHPTVLRFFYAEGQKLKQDGFVPGGKTRTPATAAQRLFPTMNP